MRNSRFLLQCSLIVILYVSSKIRNHLSQIQKYQGQPNAINLNNAESLQMHLETRLSQLDSAISMELWQVMLL